MCSMCVWLYMHPFFVRMAFVYLNFAIALIAPCDPLPMPETNSFKVLGRGKGGRENAQILCTYKTEPSNATNIRIPFKLLDRFIIGTVWNFGSVKPAIVQWCSSRRCPAIPKRHKMKQGTSRHAKEFNSWERYNSWSGIPAEKCEDADLGRSLWGSWGCGPATFQHVSDVACMELLLPTGFRPSSSTSIRTQQYRWPSLAPPLTKLSLNP